MNKWRHKPVAVEAIQNSGDEAELEAFLGSEWRNLLWAYNTRTKAVRIVNPRGTETAEEGDWIIRGVKGEIYTCMPDVFDATFVCCGRRESDVISVERRTVEVVVTTYTCDVCERSEQDKPGFLLRCRHCSAELCNRCRVTYYEHESFAAAVCANCNEVFAECWDDAGDLVNYDDRASIADRLFAARQKGMPKAAP